MAPEDTETLKTYESMNESILNRDGKNRFLGKRFSVFRFLEFSRVFIICFWVFRLSVQTGGTQILRPKKNILYTILHVPLFLLGKWRDVRTQKSRLKYEMKYDLYYSAQVKKRKKNFKIGLFDFWCFQVLKT